MIKKIFLSKYSLFLSMILGLLGIQTSCTVEYGTPTATYKINGVIKSDSTNIGISNIKISMFSDSAYSNVNGDYYFAIETIQTDQITISFTDIDDTINGKFQNKDTLVDFTNATFTNGDGHWYNGETSKEINVKLKHDN